jgi:WD40 repeat protein
MCNVVYRGPWAWSCNFAVCWHPTNLAAMSKRPGDDAGMQLQKRARLEEVPEGHQAMTLSQNAGGKGPVGFVKRTSQLQAPIMVLSGHSSEILDARFNSTGDCVASTSKDRTICPFCAVAVYLLLTPPSQAYGGSTAIAKM